jgi:hypothetical protein
LSDFFFMQLRRASDNTIITLPEAALLGTGGEARVYALPQEPHLAAKVYHQPDKLHARKLAAMLANPPRDPMQAQGHSSISWPVDLLHTISAPPQVAGFLMPRVAGMRCVIDFYHPGTRRKSAPLFNYFYLHRAARNLAAAVRALHTGGYVIGDVNESNVLVSETALVTLVDTDSFQVRDREAVYRCPVGKAEFTPPELQEKPFAELDRAPEHDLFGLGVLLFQLLLEGAHPFAGVFTGLGEPPPLEQRISAGHFPFGAGKRMPYRPMPTALPFGVLHPRLRQLFAQCFVAGHHDPQARPAAQTWAEALKEAEETLRTCARNSQHRYGNHLSNCPWCERTLRLGGRDPFPSPEAVKLRQHLKPAPRRPRPVLRSAYFTPAPPTARAGGRTPAPQLVPNYTPVIFAPPAAPPAWYARLTSIGKFVFPVLWLLFVAANIFQTFYAPDLPRQAQAQPTLAAIPRATPAQQLPGHGAWITTLAFAPGGKLLASGSLDKTIRFWEAPSGQLQQTLQGHTEMLAALAFAPGGQLLASGSFDFTIKLWDVLTGRLQNTFETHDGTVTALAFSPDGRLLLSAGRDQRLILTDLATGKVKLRTQWPSRWILAVAFAPDGKSLLAGDESGSVLVLDAQTGAEKQRLYRSSVVGVPSGGVKTLAFSHNRRLVAFGTSRQTVELWDLQGGVLKQRLTDNVGEPSALAFSPGDLNIVCGNSNGTLAVWATASGLRQRLWRGYEASVMALAFAPDGRALASSPGSAPYVVSLWGM